ncbi:MAG: hypothetical protein M9907_15050 [Burkholderiaceae bacterium]|nr:hypothetical protein [Burkholderiaceae bacterium]
MNVRLPKTCGVATGMDQELPEVFYTSISMSYFQYFTIRQSACHDEKWGWCVAMRQFLIVERHSRRQKRQEPARAPARED